MIFSGPLFAVKSMAVSKAFYQEVLGQKVILDFGTNVTFGGGGPHGEGGFSLQEGFAELVDFPPEEIRWKSHSAELYFESEAFEDDVAKLKAAGVTLLHGVKAYPWGQSVIRFFDPDGHIVELGERMTDVVKRFLREGLSEEEVSTRTMCPLEFVRACRDGNI